MNGKEGVLNPLHGPDTLCPEVAHTIGKHLQPFPPPKRKQETLRDLEDVVIK